MSLNENVFMRSQNIINEMIKCQKKLFSIVEDEIVFNEVWDLFEENVIIKLKQNDLIYYEFVIHLIMFAVECNFYKVELYCTFITEFNDQIRQYFLPIEIIKIFRNEPDILETLLTNQVISIKDIVYNLKSESVIENFSDEVLDNSVQLIEAAPSMKSLTNTEYIIRQIKSKQNGKDEENPFFFEEFDDDSELVNHIKNDDIDQFQLLIALSNIDINTKLSFKHRYSLNYDQSLSLIEFAAKSKSLKIFKFLFVHPKIVISKSLFRYAISGGSYDIIHICESKFTDKSLDIDTVKEAIRINQNEIFHYLNENYDIELSIHCLYYCLDYCNLELFFELFPLININDSIINAKNDFTLIHRVCFHGFYYILEILLQIKEFEIFLDKENSVFQAPIVVAAENFHSGIVKLLNETGKISSKSLQTAAVRAVVNGSYKCVKYLLDFVNINERINGNTTFLHLAIYNDHLDIVKLLLTRKDININACSSSGFTPIHHAIILGNAEVVSLLLDMPTIDKSLNVQSYLKETPLMAAMKMKNQKIIDMIQNHMNQK